MKPSEIYVLSDSERCSLNNNNFVRLQGGTPARVSAYGFAHPLPFILVVQFTLKRIIHKYLFSSVVQSSEYKPAVVMLNSNIYQGWITNYCMLSEDFDVSIHLSLIPV